MKDVGKPEKRLVDTFLIVEKQLKRYLMRLIKHRHDIEDIVQETILRACEVEKITEIKAPKSFLFKIAHNLALSEITKRRVDHHQPGALSAADSCGIGTLRQRQRRGICAGPA